METLPMDIDMPPVSRAMKGFECHGASIVIESDDEHDGGTASQKAISHAQEQRVKICWKWENLVEHLSSWNLQRCRSQYWCTPVFVES